MSVRPDSRSTFYRRALPAPAIALSSERGRALFRDALGEGTLEGYFALAEQFHTQSEPAWCGLGTLVIVLNAMAIDPGRVWKGPWRWYSEEMLDCCKSVEAVKRDGINFDELACVARCNGADVDASRGDTLSLDAFRAAILGAAQQPGDPHAVVSYSRAELGQTGDGHFSPVAGLHGGLDLALILDTARFKYPPHWVPVEALWRATQRIDAATGQARGLLLFRRAEHRGALCSLSCHQREWAPIRRWLRNDARQLLAKELAGCEPNGVAQVEAVIRVLERAPQPLARGYLLPDPLPPPTRALLDEIRGIDLYGIVDAHGDNAVAAEVTTLLLLALAPSLPTWLGAEADAGLFELRDASESLRSEVGHLRAQISALDSACC